MAASGNRPFIILVTGGIGSGKSLVCRYLAEMGLPVYDSDSRTKELYDTYPGLLPKLEEAFGLSLRTAEGLLDRKLLASIIFNDADKLSILESIVHPLVREDFESWAAASSARAVVFESAIVLQKASFLDFGDLAVEVCAPVELRAARAAERDNVCIACVMDRIRTQMSQPRLREADYVIMNDSTATVLKTETESLYLYVCNKLNDASQTAQASEI